MEENKPITVQYLGREITFDNIEDMAKSVNATIKQNRVNVVEIPNGYSLNLYTGIITNYEDKRVIIPRDNLSELLNFLADKGYLSLKEIGKGLDDLLDEFENLED